MKWFKKWSFLLLLTGMGVIYLSAVDRWQVYAESLNKAKVFYQKMLYGEQVMSDSVTGYSQGEGVSDGPGADRVQGEGTETEADGTGPGTDGDGQAHETDGTQTGKEQDDRLQGEVGQSGNGPDGADGDSSGQDDKEEPGKEDGFWDGSAPVYKTVEDDYFADAVFIGDSRTVGMFEYGGLEEIATFYASKGLTIYRLFESQVVEVPGQLQKLTIEDALLNNEFKKIYLMVGINEMGTGTVETFTAKYQEVVEHLLELQPYAIVYIQGILKVTTERSNQGDYITNEGIVARNQALAELADNRRIFYLDANPLICDETGGMVPSYTFDGVHLKARYIDIWKNYLKEHAIDLGE